MIASGGPGDPADAPADHPVLLRERADDERPLGHALELERMDELAPVVEERLHRGVVDERQVVLTAQVARERPVLPREGSARRHRRAHQHHRRGLRADRGRERVLVEPPFSVDDAKRREDRRAAREMDPVHDPRVGRVGDDDLVARVDGREEAVEEPRQAARGDDQLGLRVVAMARSRRGEVRDRGAQVEVALEREPAVRLGPAEGRLRLGQRLRRERQVRVEVLEPQDRPARVGRRDPLGGGRDDVQADAADVGQTLRALHGRKLRKDGSKSEVRIGFRS